MDYTVTFDEMTVWLMASYLVGMFMGWGIATYVYYKA